MGAEPWLYFAPFHSDVLAALESLRQSVFASGSYQIGRSRPGTSVGSIQDALKLAGADGTRSILDITNGIASQPRPGSLWRFPPQELEHIYGTDQPTREMIADADELFDRLNRGEAAYVTVYTDGRPTDFLFIGYSFD